MRPVTELMDAAPKTRRTLFLAVILAMLAGILLSTVYLSLATSRLAKTETLKLGDALALQSEALIRPLILSNDRVSLNYLLNELAQTDHIEGLQVKDRNGVLIARAGEVSDIKQVRHLLQQDKSIGSFTLWLSQAPTRTMLTSQHIPLLILSCMGCVFVLLAIWFTTRQTQVNRTASQEEAIKEPLDFPATLAMETEQQGFATVEEEENTTEPSVDKPAQTAKKGSESSDITNHQLFEAEETGFQQESAVTNYQAADLVDLLKPEPSTTPQMPKFEHHPQDLESEHIERPDEPLIFEEQDLNIQAPASPESNASENPLYKMQERNEKGEQQLELYSFEHELELILSPQDAIYLFYIDTHTASSDNISSKEKDALVNVYFHLVKQVARIYNGEAEQLENNDILLRFELRDDQDSHGINALCAAILFNLLYKGFNQSRIKGFQPVLSLQMSIARGHHSRYNLVQEEAHFLTRTTHSNELISHTALSEAPIIKKTLLENSDIRREDEDKVLVMKLTAKHQALLQKQANHLLTKIFKK